MAQLEALIFDVDGTLADTERDGHRVAFNQAFAEAGLDWEWSPELYGELVAVTGGKERIRYYLDKFHTAFKHPDNLDGFIAGLHAAKTAFYTELLNNNGIPLRPGVRRLIEEAKEKGLRLAIATTTTPANVTALLCNAMDPNAQEWFDVIAAGDIVPAKKPAPDIYVWAMEQMNLKPEQCIALEDSDNGLKSVMDAGIRSVVVTVNGYTENQDFTGAPLVLDQMGEPDYPCKTLQGDQPAGGMLNVATLETLHAKVHG